MADHLARGGINLVSGVRIWCLQIWRQLQLKHSVWKVVQRLLETLLTDFQLIFLEKEFGQCERVLIAAVELPEHHKQVLTNNLVAWGLTENIMGGKVTHSKEEACHRE